MPVTYVREKLIRAAKPNIDRILSNRGALIVEMVFPEPTAVPAARVQVKKSGRVLFTDNLSSITKSASISLLRSITKGNAEVELQIKDSNDAWEIIDTKTANF